MIFLAKNDLLGELNVQEVFLYYDGPRLFLASNAAGQMYLVNCLDIQDNSDIWLASAISEKRLLALKNGTLALRDAFEKPELDKVHELTTNKDGMLVGHSLKSPKQLVNDDLPEPGVLLKVEEPERVATNAVFSARSLNANIVLLHLYPNRKHVEAAADAVGNILSSFQQYVSTKIERALSKVTLSGGAELPAFQVNFLGTFAGSLGVELAIRGEDARIGKVIEDAVEDLGTADELDVFRERMEVADDAEVKAMGRFMSDLAKAESDLQIESASPSDSEPHYAVAALPRLREAAKSLRRTPTVGTDTKTLIVELIGLNLRTRRFELRVVETDEKIIGGMAVDIFNDLQRAELPSRYRVVLEGAIREDQRGRRKTTAWKMISAVKL